MKTRLIVGVIIENGKGEILLGKKRGGRVYPDCWLIPGGGVEEGEAIEDAVRREVKEETGLDVQDITRLNFDEDYTWRINEQGIKQDIHFVTLNYKAQMLGGKLSPDDDLVNLLWVKKEDLKSYKHNPLSMKLFKSLGWL
jgi:mutator protein MutT